MKRPFDEVPESEADHLGEAELRRRRLLTGLGKASMAVAAMSPMASHATRKYTLANPMLPNGLGYCSVSGFHSAAISAAPDGGFKTCSAFKPSHFFVENPQIAFVVTGSGANARRNAIRSACSFTNNTTGNNAAQLLANGSIAGYVRGPSGYELYIPLPGDKIRKITPSADFPTLTLTRGPLAPFNGLFTASLTSNPLLYQLTLNDDDAYFLAAFLSCLKDPSGLDVGNIPFDASYVLAQYGTAGAAAFFRALCTVP